MRLIPLSPKKYHLLFKPGNITFGGIMFWLNKKQAGLVLFLVSVAVSVLFQNCGKFQVAETTVEPSQNLQFIVPNPQPISEQVVECSKLSQQQIQMKAIQLSSNFFGTCALLESKQVACWGQNFKGRFGIGSANVDVFVPPTLIPGLSHVKQISLGASNSCALTEDGEVYCWGENAYGEVGDGSTVPKYLPVKVALPAKAEMISSKTHSCALLIDSTVSCWGYNYYHEISPSADTFVPTPSTIANLNDVAEISDGASPCVRLRNGTVKCWGRNHRGQLGTGSLIPAVSDMPVQVLGLSDVKEVSTSGYYFSCARLSDRIECWGYNNGKYLGTDDYIDRSTPVKVMGIEPDVPVQLSVGHGTACSLLSSGKIICWGGYGYLANKPMNDFATNRQLKVTEVSAGTEAACAILSDRSVVCFDGTSKNKWNSCSGLDAYSIYIDPQ